MPGLTVAEKLIESHLVSGSLKKGSEISLKIDQTLCQDATGTMVMLELEAMNLDVAKTDVSVQYVDHNLVQSDYKNADDHVFLKSACERFGIWYSRPGNGISHPVHMQYFGKPGTTLIGSDSHTCANGALGMLCMGAGGLDVAMAISGYPYFLIMPKIWGIHLTGKLPDWVSAKDVILEVLRRHDVKGGVGYIIEYYGPGCDSLSISDRHVIANMGAELGATTSVFASDEKTKQYFATYKRLDDWKEIKADSDAVYDRHDEIDLTTLEPMIALPTSPGNVRKVAECVGKPVYQAYIGSSANPGYRDFAIAAEIVKGNVVSENVSLDVNPSSRDVLMDLTNQGYMANFISAGARIHQAGCNGCIGMGQAPATGKNSLRTVPRNFPGRSGTIEDSVFLCSPETAAASALTGKITDPRTLDMTYPDVSYPESRSVNPLLVPPLSKRESDRDYVIEKGPNIKSLPDFKALSESITANIIIKLGDNISTDGIMPAGSAVLPFRSNVEKISDFTFYMIDPTYVNKAQNTIDQGHVIVAGENYGQGSSREHAVLAPRYLGLKIVLAKSFARIHKQNLINFGVLPLVFKNDTDYEKISVGNQLSIAEYYEQLMNGSDIEIRINNGEDTITATFDLTERQKRIVKEGGLINCVKNKISI